MATSLTGSGEDVEVFNTGIDANQNAEYFLDGGELFTGRPWAITPQPHVICQPSTAVGLRVRELALSQYEPLASIQVPPCPAPPNSPSTGQLRERPGALLRAATILGYPGDMLDMCPWSPFPMCTLLPATVQQEQQAQSGSMRSVDSSATRLRLRHSGSACTGAATMLLCGSPPQTPCGRTLTRPAPFQAAVSQLLAAALPGPAGAACRMQLRPSCKRQKAAVKRRRRQGATDESDAGIPPVVSRNRQVQRAYMQRKRAKQAAVFAREGELRAARATLVEELSELLIRHQRLAALLPLDQRQGEEEFRTSLSCHMAELLNCPGAGAHQELCPADATWCMVGKVEDAQQSNMGGPACTPSNCPATWWAGSSDAGLGPCCQPVHEACYPPNVLPAEGPAALHSTSGTWDSVMASLALSPEELQRLGNAYSENTAALRLLHEHCTAVARQLQWELPAAMGSGRDARAALLSMEAAAAQLEAISTCERRLADALRMALLEVLHQGQRDMLCTLAPPEQLDPYAFCKDLFRRHGLCDCSGNACAAGTAPQPFPDAPCELGADLADSSMAFADVPCCSGSDMLEELENLLLDEESDSLWLLRSIDIASLQAGI